MKKETENWLKIANNDLKTAKALFKENVTEIFNKINDIYKLLEKNIQ